MYWCLKINGDLIYLKVGVLYSPVRVLVNLISAQNFFYRSIYLDNFTQIKSNVYDLFRKNRIFGKLFIVITRENIFFSGIILS